MTPERWREVERLYELALAQPESERAAFVKRAGVDKSVRRAVELLLVVHGGAEGFLETPALDVVARAVPRRSGPERQMVGVTVSHYRIEERLGGGGMGVVYRASDTRLQRRVALKFLPQTWSDDPEARARFEREARAAAALN